MKTKTRRTARHVFLVSAQNSVVTVRVEKFSAEAAKKRDDLGLLPLPTTMADAKSEARAFINAYSQNKEQASYGRYAVSYWTVRDALDNGGSLWTDF